jgi:hypothetical protein
VNCGAQDDTVVLAHMPNYGITETQGQSRRCDDFWAAHLCVRCHELADSGPYRRDHMWRARMVYRTLRRLFADGILKA